MAEDFAHYHRKVHQLSVYLVRANVDIGSEVRCDS